MQTAVLKKPNTKIHHKNPAAENGGDSIRIWGCFAFPSPKKLAINNGL